MASAALKIVDNDPEKIAEPIAFDDFWTLYSRREARKDAMKAWQQISPREQLAAVCAAMEWRRIWAAQGRATHHIPLAATWLRAERWEDDLPPEFSRATSASHVSAKPPEKYERSDMPPSVLAAIAKLRKG